MSKRNMPTSVATTVGAAVPDAFTMLQGIRDEVRESYDNLQDHFANAQRTITLGETADTLDQFVDEEHDVPECVSDIPITYLKPALYRGRTTRPKQRDEATGMLDAAICAMREWADEEANAEHEDRDTVVELADTLEEAMNEADGVEFPGMYQ